MKRQIKKPVTVEKVVERVVEETTEIVDEPGGMDTLLGQKVLVICNYFYYGVLTGVNGKCIELSKPSIVYQTGNWKAAKFDDAQELPCDRIFINMDAIESYVALDKK